jgi:hypothetical protein
MEIKFQGRHVSFNKELNVLDELALHFSEKLNKTGIKHVFLSGYVAILFGRNRTSEDIDVVCKTVPFETFKRFWDDIHENLECIITSDMRIAYNDYLKKGTAVQFAYRGKFIPNIEMKFATTDMHREALSHVFKVVVNGRNLLIPSLEQQIAYKLFMGSEKDIEDARFLFKLFDKNLDKQKLIVYLKALNVTLGRSKRYLGWSN